MARSSVCVTWGGAEVGAPTDAALLPRQVYSGTKGLHVIKSLEALRQEVTNSASARAPLTRLYDWTRQGERQACFKIHEALGEREQTIRDKAF